MGEAYVRDEHGALQRSGPATQVAVRWPIAFPPILVHRLAIFIENPFTPFDISSAAKWAANLLAYHHLFHMLNDIGTKCAWNPVHRGCSMFLLTFNFVFLFHSSPFLFATTAPHFGHRLGKQSRSWYAVDRMGPAQLHFVQYAGRSLFSQFSLTVKPSSSRTHCLPLTYCLLQRGHLTF